LGAGDLVVIMIAGHENSPTPRHQSSFLYTHHPILPAHAIALELHELATRHEGIRFAVNCCPLSGGVRRYRSIQRTQGGGCHQSIA
jgi:hypothetical protein